jgi:hypothetical protein
VSAIEGSGLSWNVAGKAWRPSEDLELLQALEDRIDLAAARKALKKEPGWIQWEKVKRDLGL